MHGYGDARTELGTIKAMEIDMTSGLVEDGKSGLPEGSNSVLS